MNVIFFLKKCVKKVKWVTELRVPEFSWGHYLCLLAADRSGSSWRLLLIGIVEIYRKLFVLKVIACLL